MEIRARTLHLDTAASCLGLLDEVLELLLTEGVAEALRRLLHHLARGLPPELLQRRDQVLGAHLRGFTVIYGVEGVRVDTSD